ncbi:MAG TPA: sugar ABC transporter permease [Acholeplasmataceae bacterium]|jgi:multiple sugar transport system permease protein|nr:sugar ABC transporter permease [Acholeplasmataceae bacterium]
MEKSLPGKIIDRTGHSYKIKRYLRKNLGGWLIMLPGLVLFTFFVWKPLFHNIIMSFSHTTGLKINGFAGFTYYREVFNDPMFLDALLNTFKYLFWSIIIGFFIPIILGLLLSEVVHFRGLIRLGIYFPSIVSGIAVVIMWSYLFDPNPGAVLNQVLKHLGFNYSQFLSNPKLTIPLIVVTMTWRGAGATTLIYLSSLQNISTSQYEAARIDGANWFNRLRYVTLPHLKPTIRMLFILQVISVFQVFYEPLVMTDGGPNGASMSLLLLSYKYYFDSMEASKSAAVAVFLALIIIVLTLIYLRISRPKSEEKNV